ncbi:glucosamine inositolphosphorylceramide transferase family protein [Roseibium sp.]|uniref:glucosamine inositolphosphorylceramide transferase family protein n=1 Tax=Roseibium sp. TaxID=1936156 RepID=UPI003B51B746
MRVEIVIEKDRVRGWLLHLVEVLKKSRCADVVFRFVDPEPPVSNPLKTLLAFEKVLMRSHRPCGSEVIDADRLPQARAGEAQADWTFNLTSKSLSASSGQTFDIRFEGEAGEEALFAALLTKGTPTIEIVELSSGQVAAHGTASLEAAVGTGGAMEAVYSRVAILINRVIAGAREHGTPIKTVILPPISLKQVTARMLRESVVMAIRTIYGMCFHASHWRIGWRFGAAESVAANQDLGGAPWKVLASPHDHFYADPFLFEKDGRHFLFLEDLPQKTQKGVISMVEMSADGPVSDVQTVLEEPWHLSYPFVFERDGSIWMIPESSTNHEVVLYRAAEFPLRWERHTVLLADVEAADATIVEHDGRLWMFAVTRNGTGGYSDTLSIYYADELTGPWHSHEGNPVIVNDRTARPAGEFYHQDGKLWRPVQDCRNGYGAALALATVDELTPSTFKQTVHKTLTPGAVWPGRKLHTLNKAGDLEVIDGCTYHPRSRTAAYLKDLFVKPPS